MLQINIESENKLYVKCNDLLTIEDPIYLWRFYDEQRKTEYLIELLNESSVNPRFDLFTLNLPDDLDLKNGVYSWEVYQSDTEGATNYEDMPLLSNGMAKVINEFEENASYTPTGTDTVYGG